ncbi:MAG: HEPN domain-containing protein [Candidatus Latescibacteria bacterium]|nr:HEPN domain-containing protein [Candidatus Latescibacterota bacterium]
MNNNAHEAKRWFDQGVRDRAAAESNRTHGFHEVACFLCQQSAEKLLKAFLYLQGERMVIGHSTLSLAEKCQAYDERFAGVLDACRKLDQLYIPTRYPNGLPDKTPGEFFNETSSREALESLQPIFALVSEVMKG